MRKTHLRQFLTSLSAFLISLNFAASLSWASLSFEELQKNPSLLPTGVISLNEASLMVTLPNLGGLIGNFVFIFIGERYGHKRTILWLGAPQIISWLLILFAQNVYYLYVARILVGLAGGATNNCLPIFITEIADYQIRNVLNTINTVSFSTGILYGFLVGRYFEYRMQAILLLLIPVIFVCTFFFVHETPIYLRKMEKNKRLKKSVKFYGGKKAVDEIFKIEAETFGLETEAKALNENTEPEIEAPKPKLTLQDFLQPAARNGFLITLLLFGAQQLSGFNTLINYTASVFVESGSNLSILDSSMIIGLVQLLATVVTIVVIKKFGGKLLFVVSTAGTGLGMVMLAVYNLHRNSIPTTYNWFPIASFSFIMFIGSIGLSSVPCVLPFDILPLNVRSAVITFVTSLTWISTFLLNMIYPIMTLHFGLHGSLFIFAGVCFISVIVSLIIIPETKGRTYASIMDLLEK